MDDGFRGLKLWNTMTRTKEEFRPLDWRDPAKAEADRRVRLYVCGPTVYDYAHIGNARPVIVFDVLYRLLRHLYGEDHVTYVRNITDVDDKINARAARDYPDLPLNEAIAKVTQATAEQYHADVAALGCLPPTHEPRATEFVTGRADGHDMVSMIRTLIDKGNAYEADGEVLFDVTSMPDYGKLSNRRLEDQQAGARIAVDSHKKNPGDFVLWKQSAENEPGWDSPWGRGRPGWHIECSAMSEAYLGKTFDIHGGGLDLIFPHHENEIAQSRCAHGTDQMAQVWMHNGYLQVEGRKMSKSEGNFVTIADVLQREIIWLTMLSDDSETWLKRRRQWNGLAARLAILQSHYRAPIDWTDKRHIDARAEIYDWYLLIKKGFSPIRTLVSDVDVVTSLKDDMNTPDAIAGLRRLYSARDALALRDGMEILGLYDTELADSFDTTELDLDAETRMKIDQRLALIREKNWPEADRIRDELLAKGIQLKDGKDPETGERITTWEVKR
ncbi:MAG TPA: cysteine--tRNA ligase [Aurantimonas sp.]